MKEHSYFPMFMDLTGKHILVIGAGKIASRRIRVLTDFTDSLTVIAPQISSSVRGFAEDHSNISIVERQFSFEDLNGMDIVIAATDDHKLNESVAKKCREIGILVNAVHNRALCDFYFPGIVIKDDVVVGVTVSGRDHRTAKEVTGRIKDMLSVNEMKECSMQEKKRILVVSFGSSYPEARKYNIDVIADLIQKHFPDHELQQCFTSRKIIDIIEKRDGIHIDDLTQALDKAISDQISELLIQPTHVLGGTEFQKIIDETALKKKYFKALHIGYPLLFSDDDHILLAELLAMHTKGFMDGNTAAVFVGHGTKAQADDSYRRLQSVFSEKGFEDHYVGTIESYPSKDDLISIISEKNKYKRIVLLPLMVVIGDHAHNDIFGGDDSWKSAFEEAGFEVISVKKGLSEYPEVADIYVKHLSDAMNI